MPKRPKIVDNSGHAARFRDQQPLDECMCIVIAIARAGRQNGRCARDKDTALRGKDRVGPRPFITSRSEGLQRWRGVMTAIDSHSTIVGNCLGSRRSPQRAARSASLSSARPPVSPSAWPRATRAKPGRGNHA